MHSYFNKNLLIDLINGGYKPLNPDENITRPYIDSRIS